jgi:uncharacterized protein
MRNAERFQQLSDLPATIPVFPLGGVILLPRANLPLNIFEPRYLQMFDDALSGSRLVGVIQPSRDAVQTESPAGDPPLRTTGCAGRITAFQELDDGRLIVSLAGLARFSVISEPPSDKPYRTCAVDYRRFSRDLVAESGADEVDRDALLVALKRFLEARSLKADWAAISKSGNETLVNALSIMSPFGPAEKQALLEAETLKTRAELLVALAEMEVAAAGRGGGSGSTLQ